jgi:hypothetical protein
MSSAPAGTAAASPPSATSPSLAPTPAGWFDVRSDVDPRIVVITFGTGDCDGAARATAVDDRKVVSVSLVVNRLTAGACDAALRLRYLSVQLPTDLAGRSVYDAVDHRLHKPFDGAALLTPRHLPAGFTIVQEGSPDSGTSNPSTVLTTRYWVRTWSLPEIAPAARNGPNCSARAPRTIQLGQGPGALPHWETAQVHQVGIVPIDGLNVPLLRVTATGDLDLTWRDPTSHQDFQLDSGRQCDSAPAYTVTEFTQIATFLASGRWVGANQLSQLWIGDGGRDPHGDETIDPAAVGQRCAGRGSPIGRL